MNKRILVTVVGAGVLWGGLMAAHSQSPVITGLSLTNQVLTITFSGGELETAGTLSGPWTGTGNTHGEYTEVIGAGTANKFFRVAGPSLPAPATDPNPADQATNVLLTASLSWTAGSRAISHNVYFGTSSPGTFRGNQAGTTFNPGTLANNTTYYWRIDEVNAFGTTTGAVWNFTTEAAFPVVISNVNPPNNAVGSNVLAVGQLIYTDRTYAFTSVASLGGKTYIMTANNDKQSTASSYLTFTVNQDATVYVAHDNTITPKPSWLSSFTDTGENLATTDSGKTFRLYRKDSNAGTVSLGGNAGGVSSSMYSVVVVGKGTVTPSLSSDFYSDTWVAVDALGRELPDYAIVGAPRTNRTVALFYFLTFGTVGACDTPWDNQGPWDITKILAANPTNPAWGPAPCYFPQAGAAHHWGEPELGYYLSNDQWVMRKHAYMLANADVDVIVFDISNAYTYTANYLAVCSVFANVRAIGGRTPQICFLANWNADGNVQSIYDNLYSKGLYSDLWFYWKGKPLVLAPLQGMADPAGGTINYSTTVQNYFNFRYSWADTAGSNIWNWIAYYPQSYGWSESSSIPEQVSVSVGRHPNANPGRGRSYRNGSQPAYDNQARTGKEHLGWTFAEQWARLTQIDPELVFITGWNEWTAGRFIIPFDGPYSGNYPFLNGTVGPGGTLFVDAYTQEFSRDVEPMKGGHTDNYYYQMIDGIRRYKGVRPLPAPSAPKTITMDGTFNDWGDVGPDYRDWLGDTLHRNTAGWGSAGTYTNFTGRNDLVLAKVARDDTYVYFYMQTDVNITPYTGSNWMLLFLNADQDYRTGWEGYDYVVNLGVNSATSTTLKRTGSGWNWTNVNANIAYQVSSNRMELRIPRVDIAQGSGTNRVAFDFKWADNIQTTNDIIQFALSGDSAPDRRFNYRYDTSPWTQLTYDDFEVNFGNYTDGGANCSRYTAVDNAHHGRAAINIQASGDPSASFYHTAGLNVSAYSQLKVEFWYYAVGMEAGESFVVEYSANGGANWQTVATYTSGTHFTNGAFYQVAGTDLVLNNGPYTFPTDAKFRFRCVASDSTDDIYIDEVKISAR